MLVGLLNLIFNLVSWALNIAGWVLLIYVVLSLVIPQSKVTQTIGRYAEPLLSPLRRWLNRTFSKLCGGALDFSPVALWLLLEVAGWLVGVLRNILL